MKVAYRSPWKPKQSVRRMSKEKRRSVRAQFDQQRTQCGSASQCDGENGRQSRCTLSSIELISASIIIKLKANNPKERTWQT